MVEIPIPSESCGSIHTSEWRDEATRRHSHGPGLLSKLLIATSLPHHWMSRSEAQILEFVTEAQVDTEASILYITHDLAVAAQICDRIG